MPDLFTLNQEYSFCLSKARVICVKMTSSIDRLPTHCACTLRQHSEYIEQHTQRFFSHPVASCNVHLVLFPCICWDFTKVLLCEWRSWFIKPDFTSIQAICPAVLEIRQGHPTPIPSHGMTTLLNPVVQIIFYLANDSNPLKKVAQHVGVPQEMAHMCAWKGEGGCSGADFSTNQFLRPPPPRLPLLLPCWCSEWPTALLQG